MVRTLCRKLPAIESLHECTYRYSRAQLSRVHVLDLDLVQLPGVRTGTGYAVRSRKIPTHDQFVRL